MAEIMIKLLELINSEYTLDDISLVTGLSYRQIYNYLTILSNKGFEFERKYYSTGDILYRLRKELVTSNNAINLYTGNDEKVFRALLISDLHLGNKLQRVDYINLIFEYCIRENIHIILCGGDFIDGYLGRDKLYSDGEEQIKQALSDYPVIRNILTFTVLGDHDYSVLNSTGQNFMRIINNYRHDIIPVGYGQGSINLKNDKVYLCHNLSRYKINLPAIGGKSIVFSGHSHKMQTFMRDDNYLQLSIPLLCDLYDDNRLPGAVKAELTFNNGVIIKGAFEQLAIIDNNIYEVGKISADLGAGKKQNQQVQLEDKPKRKVLV